MDRLHSWLPLRYFFVNRITNQMSFSRLQWVNTTIPDLPARRMEVVLDSTLVSRAGKWEPTNPPVSTCLLTTRVPRSSDLYYGRIQSRLLRPRILQEMWPYTWSRGVNLPSGRCGATRGSGPFWTGVGVEHKGGKRCRLKISRKSESTLVFVCVDKEYTLRECL